MIIHASGGCRTNGIVPEWFVGCLPSLSAATVVHQGTATTDRDVYGSFYPDILIHAGFALSQASSFPGVLGAVAEAKVTVVGHSLGGAIALLGMSHNRLTATISSF